MLTVVYAIISFLHLTNSDEVGLQLTFTLDPPTDTNRYYVGYRICDYTDACESGDFDVVHSKRATVYINLDDIDKLQFQTKVPNKKYSFTRFDIRGFPGAEQFSYECKRTKCEVTNVYTAYGIRRCKKIESSFSLERAWFFRSSNVTTCTRCHCKKAKNLAVKCVHWSGKCPNDECADNYQGFGCYTCRDGTYGTDCAGVCSKNCQPSAGICNKTSGDCLDGCRPGYLGNKCAAECDSGKWGGECRETCSVHCAAKGTAVCSHIDGQCSPCEDDWYGKRCDVLGGCDVGKHGNKCDQPCPKNCERNTCDRNSGNCSDGCKRGFWGKGSCEKQCINCEDDTCDIEDGQCSDGCKAGFWGQKACENPCVNCHNVVCDKTTGMCSYGCAIGFWGQDTCIQTCVNCKGDKCVQDNGTCSDGCKSGFWGEQTCDRACITKAPCDDVDQTRYCPKLSSTKYPQYSYNATLNGETFVIRCVKGTITRECVKGVTSTWESEIDAHCQTPEVVLDELQMMIKRDQNLSANEIPRIVQDLSLLADSPTNNRKSVERVMSIVGNFIVSDTWLSRAEEKDVDVYDLVSILEKLSRNIDVDNDSDNLIQTNDIGIHVYKIDETTDSISADFHFDTDSNTSSVGPSVVIPGEAMRKLKKANNKRVQIIGLRNSRLFAYNTSTKEYKDHSVVSIVFTNPVLIDEKQTAVRYWIPHDKNNEKNVSCVFWNVTARKWSTRGISSTKDHAGKKLCRSTHFTSFSILMVAYSDDPTADTHDASLTYISYIGCGISIIALLLTIVTYALFKSLWRDISGKVLINICVSMVLLNSSFLAHDTLDSNAYNKGACMMVANFLHYFLLTTLAWMMIEALHMHQKLIIVFSKIGRRFMQIRMIAGWGIPLLVVGVTAAVTHEDYTSKRDICFLSHVNKAAFYSAVLAPSCVILIVNLVVFIRVAKLVFRKQTVAVDATTVTSTVSLTQVRGAMSVMIVLGVTWIFGPLAIGPLKTVFSYLFTILNSIQGCLIFLFRCVLFAEARWGWQLLIATGQLKKRRGSLTGTTGWASEKTGNTWRTRSNRVGSITEVE